MLKAVGFLQIQSVVKREVTRWAEYYPLKATLLYRQTSR